MVGHLFVVRLFRHCLVCEGHTPVYSFIPPSTVDQEVNWDYVRVLPDGEAVSVDGTHLGHNIPDRSGKNRYCINLVSVAGTPAPSVTENKL